MKKFWKIAIVLTTPILSAASPEDLIETPKVDYQADLDLEFDGLAIKAKLYATPERQRYDLTLSGHEMIALIDLRRRTITTWQLALPIPFEFSLASMGLGDKESCDKIEMTKIGSEDINRIPAEKYRVAGTLDDGAHVNGHVWLGPENITVKVAGTYTLANGEPQEVLMVATALVIGKQDPTLLTVPTAGLGLPLQDLLQGLYSSTSPETPSPSASTDLDNLLNGLLDAPTR